MASLKECREKARRIKYTVYLVPKKHRMYEQGYKYILKGNGDYVFYRTVSQLAEGIGRRVRGQRQYEMLRKLNSHRPKYGYKTVPRKARKKA